MEVPQVYSEVPPLGLTELVPLGGELLQLVLQQSPGSADLGLSLLGMVLEQSRGGGVWAGCRGCRVLQRISAVLLGELVLSFQREHISRFLNLTRYREKDVDIYMWGFLNSSKTLLSPLWKVMLLRARSCLLKLYLYSVKRSASGCRSSGGGHWLAAVTLSRRRRRNVQYTMFYVKNEVFCVKAFTLVTGLTL